MGAFLAEPIEIPLETAQRHGLLRREADRLTIQIDDQIFGAVERDGIIRTVGGDLWPGGILYYQFASNVAASDKPKFLAAAKLWSDVAKVSFVEKAHSNGYVLIKNSTADSSEIGFQGVAGQPMELNRWAEQFVVAHEIGHALGFVHEHCRSDRAKFVEIYENNIIAGKEHNFIEAPKTMNGTPYDYESVMHYHAWAFGKTDSKGKILQTIAIQPPNTYDIKMLGQRTKLSKSDKDDMIAAYGKA